MKQLIINADDFGLHPLINKGIIKGHSEGIITSTSLMPSAPYIDEAVQLAKKNRAGNIIISFEHGNVNLAIESSKDWFEIPILKPATRIENYRAIVFELINILKIIDSLKMEQNIGL